MKGYETKIEIIADKKTIWNKLMDTKNYNLWNPLISDVDNDFELGKKTEVTIVPLTNKIKITPCEIIENKKLVWYAIQIHPFLLKVEHYFYLSDLHNTEQEGTILVHGEKFSGIFSYFIKNKIFSKLSKGFEEHNKVLKQIIEKEVSL